MIEKTELKNIMRDCLLGEKEPDSSVREDKKLTAEVLKELISEEKNALKDKTERIVLLLSIIYEEGDVDASDPVAMFYRFIGENYLYKDASVCEKDEALSGGLKNKYLFDLVEKIRYAKMQRASLRDTSSYNRHIEKSISDMRNDLTAMFELHCTYDEISTVLEKYLEYTINVNTAKNWLKLSGLSKYEPFRQFLSESKAQLLNLFARGSIRTEALKYYVESKDTKTIDVYMNTLFETAAEDRAKAEEMISIDVCFPFDGAYLLQVVLLASAEPEEAKEKAQYFIASEKDASINVLRLFLTGYRNEKAYESATENAVAHLADINHITYDEKHWLK